MQSSVGSLSSVSSDPSLNIRHTVYSEHRPAINAPVLMAILPVFMIVLQLEIRNVCSSWTARVHCSVALSDAAWELNAPWTIKLWGGFAGITSCQSEKQPGRQSNQRSGINNAWEHLLVIVLHLMEIINLQLQYTSSLLPFLVPPFSLLSMPLFMT